MKRIFQTPRTALPLTLSLVLLASVGLVAVYVSASPLGDGGGVGLLAALLLAGTVLSLFKPRRGIALGAAVLAPAALYFGPLAGAALAALVRAAQLRLTRFPFLRSVGPSRVTEPVEGGGSTVAEGPPGAGEAPPFWGLVSPESLTGILIATLTALACTSLWWARVADALSAGRIGTVIAWSAVVGLAQSALLLASSWVVAWLEARVDSLVRRPDPRFFLEAAGWTLGGVLAVTFAAAGISVGLVVLAAVAVLVVELVRQRAELARDRREATALREMSMVGRRLDRGDASGLQLELEPIVTQILRECGNLIESPWLHLDIADSGVERTSWRMDPQRRIDEGEPEVPEMPPALPGVHRRVAWKVLERRLESGDRTIATLRLWTDPRKTEVDEVRLLDALLPQLASLLAAVLAERKAGRDALTGVATRSVLEERVERIYERCCAEGSAMAVVMCDVDRFKEINDGFGHSVGDQVLQEIAGVLARHSRGRDVVCRYGGEEFTVLMDGANARAAVAVAERLRKAIEEIRFDSDGTAILLTASFGVASFPDIYVASGSELVPLADAALYEAKRRGRNRTLLALGQGQFQNARGRSLKGDTRAEAIEAPRLFV